MPSDGKWSRVTIHCSATPNLKEHPANLIKQFHLSKGWKDIGYHRVIQPNGLVEQGRPVNQAGAHVQGANRIKDGINIGLCLIGTDRFSRLQFDALRKELDFFFQFIPKWELSCHYEYDSAKKQGKTCPNMELRRLMGWYLRGLEEAIAPYIGTS